MAFKPLKIGKYTLEYPIVQGGMGLGISWDKLAGTVSLEGGLGVISSVGTGYYNSNHFSKKNINSRPFEAENFYSKEGLNAIVANARKICGDKPLAMNILYAINDYERVIKDSCEAGVDIISKSVSKQTGVKILLENLGIDFSEVVSIGDGDNDIELLKASKIGIAMGNGSDNLKECADMVTDSIDDDGVYKAMVKLGLI